MILIVVVVVVAAVVVVVVVVVVDSCGVETPWQQPTNVVRCILRRAGTVACWPSCYVGDDGSIP